VDREFRRRSVPQFSSRRWRYSRAARLIARFRHTPLVRLGRRAAFAWLDASDNVQFSLATNGEAGLLRRLAPHGCSVVLDVGANLGDWAAAAAAALPGATVHCFELDLGTRERLTARFAGSNRFVVAPTGLDRTAGRVEYDYYTTEPALTSLVRLPHTQPSVRREAVVGTGDGYLAQAGIEAVDLLKIDVEGAEGRVLGGFEITLARRAIRMVQFEYGLANVASRTLLADMSELLDSHGFAIGRLFADGVDFASYELTAESFRGGNFVAVQRGERALLTALATRSARLPVQEEEPT
jgi:FkbM family methyltransferase